VGTKRTPVNRDHRRSFTPQALDLFRKLKAAKAAPRSGEWWDIHWLLHQELRCKPWEWPCVEEPNIERNYEPRPEALALWTALESVH
jgi:hypothetical protein